MTTLLTNDEKSSIINQHLKNLEYSKFNLEVSLIEENAKSTPETDAIAALNSQIDDVEARIAALTAELNKLA